MRDLAASLGIVFVGVPVVVAMVWTAASAPLHSPTDGLSWQMLALGAALVVVLGFGSFGAAWVLHRMGFRSAPALSAVLGMVAAGVGCVNLGAMNVVWDSSPPRSHEVELVETFRTGKDGRISCARLRPLSDAPDAPRSLCPADVLSAEHQQPGRRLVVTTHAGALGRPYATSATPVE